jgi:hypothetical protein
MWELISVLIAAICAIGSFIGFMLSQREKKKADEASRAAKMYYEKCLVYFENKEKVAKFQKIKNEIADMCRKYLSLKLQTAKIFQLKS